MSDMKNILYGVTDFVEIRKHPGGYFVDRTALIRELEKTRYALFLRPRRFGKSLLVSILQCYYDLDYADRFDEIFGGTAIGANPTDERGKYLVLEFNFSGVDKRLDEVQRSFDFYCNCKIDNFVETHAGLLPKGVPEAVAAATHSCDKLNVLMSRLKGTKTRFYILIDEYDNFTNTILAENGVEAYDALCHGEGFFKQFFTELKLGTTGSDAPVTRLFITGVTPVTLDDVTSGFNIASNISLDPTFATLAGFTHADVREMLAYYREKAGFAFDPAAVFAQLEKWYDGYRFATRPVPGESEVPQVFNPTLVFYVMQYFLRNQRFQDELVDANLRTDYAKIRYLVTVNRRINGNYHKLEDVIAEKGCTAEIASSFWARDLAKGDNFVSLLYYFGLLTIAGSVRARTRLRIPNLVASEFINDFVPSAYDDVYGIDPVVYDIVNGLEDFADTGDWRKAIAALTGEVSSYFKVRDAVEGERVVQTAMCALLKVAHGSFIVDHEREVNGGFVDILVKPQLSRYPDIGWALMIELKYLKAEEDASPAALAHLRDHAAEQLGRYAADAELAKEWGLESSGGHVKLVKLAIVFQGGDCVLCEEV